MEVSICIYDQNQPKFPSSKENNAINKMPNTPMGDYQYDDNPSPVSPPPLSSDCSSSDFSNQIQLNSLCNSNEKLLNSLTNQLRELNDELDVMVRRIDDTEEDILTRRDIYRDIERLNMEYSKEIGREEEQIEKIEFLIHNLQKSMMNRDSLLENMKVVENCQFQDNFKRKKSTTDIRYPNESGGMFTYVDSQ